MEAKILEKQALSDRDVAEIISDMGNKPDRADIQNAALGLITKLKRIKKDKAEALRKELKDMNIAIMSDEHIVTILNILPRDLAELKSVFASSKTTIDPENLQKMLDIIKKHN